VIKQQKPIFIGICYTVFLTLTRKVWLLYSQLMATVFWDKLHKLWAFQTSHKGKKRRSYHSTREEAEALMPQTSVSEKVHSFSDIMNKFLQSRNVRYTSLARYKQEIASLKECIISDQLTTDTVSLTASIINKKYSTAKAYRLIKRLLTLCKVAGVVPPYDITPKHIHQPGRALTQQEVAKLIKLSSPTHYHSLLLFLLDTGCRLGEALGLNWGDFQNGKIVINKAYNQNNKASKTTQVKTSKGNRKVTLSDNLNQILTQLRPKDSKLPIFTSPEGFRVSRWNLRRWWAPLVKKFGTPLRIHDLRHTNATFLLGVCDVRMVAARLGHTSPTTTLKIYDHYVLDDSVTAFYTPAGIVSSKKKA
jgi:integrase